MTIRGVEEEGMAVGSGALVGGLLAKGAARLGADGRAEAELLLAHAARQSRAWLFAHAGDAVGDTTLANFESLVERRARGEPVAQILGHKAFWTFDLQVTPDVLIPRAETELLVDCMLAVLPRGEPALVADLGTGSGAIALAIASERPLVEVVAVEASPEALAVARTNAERLGLSARVHCVRGHWFGPHGQRRFHAIASNPPYIAEDDPHLDEGDLRFEPRLALTSGPDGLDAIRAIVADAPGHLLPGGWLMLEHGWSQGAAVRALMAASGFDEVTTHLDLEARDRVTCGRFG